MNKLIIFVCKGNMHRSPIAERVFKKELEKRKIKNIKVESYGLQGFILPNTKGDSMKDYPDIYKNTKPHLDKIGVSLEDHKHKPLTEEVLEKSDVIISMHPLVTKILLEKYPEVKNKTFLITNLCQSDKELKDVDGSKNPKIYEETTLNTNSQVLEAFDKISELIK